MNCDGVFSTIVIRVNAFLSASIRVELSAPNEERDCGTQS
jgi:hypothetical protein